MDSPPSRQLLLTIALTALVALAGCSGLPGMGGESGGGYGVAAENLDGETIDNESSARVTDDGSYTLERITTLNTSGDSVSYEATQETTVRVDFDAGRGIRERDSQIDLDSSQPPTSITYTDGTGTYRKEGTGENATYVTVEEESFVQPVNTSAFDQNFASLIDGIAWERGGSTTVDGVAVTRYDVGNVTNATAVLGQVNDIESVDGSLYVDSSGLVRKLSLQAEFTRNDGTIVANVTQTVTSVGSTTVKEPDWLSQAQS